MNDRCLDARERLSGLIDGDLPKREKVATEEHLASCVACKGEFEALRSTVEALRTLPLEKAPPELLSRIRASIEAEVPMEEESLPFWKRLFVFPTPAFAAAGAFAFVALIGFGLFREVISDRIFGPSTIPTAVQVAAVPAPVTPIAPSATAPVQAPSPSVTVAPVPSRDPGASQADIDRVVVAKALPSPAATASPAPPSIAAPPESPEAIARRAATIVQLKEGVRIASERGIFALPSETPASSFFANTDRTDVREEAMAALGISPTIDDRLAGPPPASPGGKVSGAPPSRTAKQLPHGRDYTLAVPTDFRKGAEDRIAMVAAHQGGGVFLASNRGAEGIAISPLPRTDSVHVHVPAQNAEVFLSTLSRHGELTAGAKTDLPDGPSPGVAAFTIRIR